ncbi:RNA polymerase sigma factor [Bacteroides sp.]|uniref:RNA polymerase sigma factor n=1 Tax=Bacteroides sp. TaxID=29523 RepID=UPI003AB6B36C
MNTDKKLLRELQAGDSNAFSSIYWQYSSHIYFFINSMLHNTMAAEDITQNVFLKLWEKHESVDIEQNLEAYLFTIARNFVYKEIERQLQSESFVSKAAERKDYATIDSDIESQSFMEYLDRLIDKLPPKQKTIYILSRQKNMSYKEIAEVLSISEKTVENQLHNALKFLKRYIKTEELFLLLSILFLEC